MPRSEITIDLGVLRRNVRRLRDAAAPAELWAVVKANAYGHGSLAVSRVALEEGATALCVATVGEGDLLRRELGDARIVVLGPLAPGDVDVARAGRLEGTATRPDDVPRGIPTHLKVDTGMGRYGMKPEAAASVDTNAVVGVMTHLATADEEHPGFALAQLEAFAALRRTIGDGPTFHVANSAATLRFPEARHDAVRCGVALYGLSPFGRDPAVDGLAPVLSWRSRIAQVKTLAPGESTGYGRRFVAGEATRIGLVPVGYGDGFRRGLTGTEVLVGGERRPVVGTVSMDSFAVELEGEVEGEPVTLIGEGVLAEEHAHVLGTINYEITCGIRLDPARTSVRYVDG
jgi:alanine racemase